MRRVALAFLPLLAGCATVVSAQWAVPVSPFGTQIRLPAQVVPSGIEGNLIERTLYNQGTKSDPNNLVECLTCPDGASGATLFSSLVAAWDFNEISGNRQDEVYRDRVARQFTRATSEYLQRGSAISIADGQAYWVRAWVGSDDSVFANYPVIFGKTGSANSSLYLSAAGTLTLTGNTGDTVSEAVTGLDSTTLAKYQIVVTVSADATANVNYYANGAKDAATDTIADPSLALTWLGRFNTSYHNGTLSHVAIGLGTITDAQVLADFNNGLPLSCADTVPTPTYCLLDGTSGAESGDVVESIGGGTWTDQNTVTWAKGANLTATQTGGLLSAAHHSQPFRDFELDTDEYLSVADPWSQANVDHSYGTRIQAESLPGAGVTAQILGQWDDGVDEGYRLIVTPSDDACSNCLAYEIGDGATTPATVCLVKETNYGTISVGTQYRVRVWFDESADQCGITLGDTYTSTAAQTGDPVDSAAAFTVGAGDSGAEPFDGLIGPIDREAGGDVTTIDETEWYNSGRPIPCAAIKATQSGASLVTHCFPMNEFSGDTTDTVAGVVLADQNTVTHGVAQRGAAATWESVQFSGANQGLSKADNATLSTGDVDFTVGCHTRSPATNQNYMLFAKGQNGSPAGEWYLAQRNTGGSQFVVWDSGGTAVYTAAVTSPAARTWASYWGGHDSVNNEAWLEVDGTRNTDSTPSGLGAPSDTAVSVTIGIDSANNYDYAGRSQACFMWKSDAGEGGLLTRNQMRSVEELGWVYEKLPPSLKTNLVSCPDLRRSDWYDPCQAALGQTAQWTAVGTPTMAPGATPINSVVLAGADFEATTNEYLVAGEPLLVRTDGQAYSISIRAKSESFTNYLLGSSTDSSGANLTAANGLTLVYGGGTSDAAGVPSVVGRWENWIATVDATATANVALYRDGVVAASTTEVDPSLSLDYVGRTGANYGDGIESQLVTFTAQLTAAQARLVANYYGTCTDWPSTLPAYYACCDLSELSGDRKCLKVGGGTITLTDNNTVLSAAGQILAAEGALGTVEPLNIAYLQVPTRASSTFDSGLGSAFTWEGSVSAGAGLGVGDGVAAKWSSSYEWLITWVTNRYYLYMGDAANYCSTPAVFGTADIASHLLAIRFDGTKSTNDTKIAIWVDGTKQTLTCGGTVPTTVPTGTDPFRIAASTASFIWSGRSLGAQRLWGSALSDANVSWLCNANSTTGVCERRTDSELADRGL